MLGQPAFAIRTRALGAAGGVRWSTEEMSQLCLDRAQQDAADPAGRTWSPSPWENRRKVAKRTEKRAQGFPSSPGLGAQSPEHHPSRLSPWREARCRRSPLTPSGAAWTPGDVLKLQVTASSLSGAEGTRRPSQTSRGETQARAQPGTCVTEQKNIISGDIQVIPFAPGAGVSEHLQGFQLLAGKQTHWMVVASPAELTAC